MTEIRTTAEALEADVLRPSGAAMADGAGPAAEHGPLPASMAKRSREQKSPAEWAYERMILYIQKFEEGLDKEHEVGMGFAGSDAGTLHIRGMGFFAPDLITFYGFDQSGAKSQLVQHVTQLSVRLSAAPKLNAEPERIGFQLARALEADSAPMG